MPEDPVEVLILDLLWRGLIPRPYAEVLDVWRTSCPRLPVWETTADRGFIRRLHAPGGGLVCVSDTGDRARAPLPPSGARLSSARARKRDSHSLHKCNVGAAKGETIQSDSRTYNDVLMYVLTFGGMPR